MIRGVIFDLDGVLVSTDEFHYCAWKMIAARENIYFDKEINHRQRGVSRMESLDILLERSKKCYTDFEKQEMAETKNKKYRKLLRSLSPHDVLPGVITILSGLHSIGVKRAVGSSSKNTSLILERTGLAKWFNTVVDGNEIIASKPDPQVFILAARRLNLPSESCLVVEDAMAGIEAARRANMHVLGIGNEQSLPNVMPCVPSLANISVNRLLEL